MKTSYDTTAFAKINLFLRICGKYDNGYHRLYMLMQEIGIGDEIFVEFDDDRAFCIDIESEVDINKEKDLGYRAAKAFYDKYESILRAQGRPSVEFPYTLIKEIKKVPSQAGLGGGSSDAASVLMIMQQHFDNPLEEEDLLEISTKLGADVPFFTKGGTCICEGVGEIVTELPGLDGIPVILVKPEGGVSTPECYALSDEKPCTYTEEYKEKLNSIFGNEKLRPIDRIKEAAEYLTNDLQTPAEQILSVIKDITDAIKETGAVYTAMTGSGSCVFGIYEDDKKTEEALARLSEDSRISGCQLIPTVMI